MCFGVVFGAKTESNGAAEIQPEQLSTILLLHQIPKFENSVKFSFSTKTPPIWQINSWLKSWGIFSPSKNSHSHWAIYIKSSSHTIWMILYSSTLLNHKVAKWWGFFRPSAPICTCASLKKPPILLSIWFSEVVNDHPNYHTIPDYRSALWRSIFETW